MHLFLNITRREEKEEEKENTYNNVRIYYTRVQERNATTHKYSRKSNY